MEAVLGECVVDFYEKELEGAVDGISPELGTGGCCMERVRGCQEREREGVVQSAARGITEVAVGMTSWRVPPGERILCSQKGSYGPGKWTGS